ncbi:MAG: hypothetical protein AUJ92_08825 [Armatimonadetes bacterium CG2_30_59_28]|nr:MAG: hypothetical protein AUJ92_08825 [Armatimonadetes bacterium CG2_30_59_28]
MSETPSEVSPCESQDLAELAVALEEDPGLGVPIPGYGHRVWKIRWPSRDLMAGKRGGLRVIYSWQRSEPVVYLLLAYVKPRKGDVTDQELDDALREAGL